MPYDDELTLDELLRRRQMNQVAYMNAPQATPPPVPTSSGGGFFSKIVGPVAKLGGAAATVLGHPEIGVPLSIAGGAVGGGGKGGVKGAVVEGGKEGLMQAVSGGFGSAATPSKEIVSSGGKALTQPGKEATGLFKMFGGGVTPATTGYSSSGSPFTIPAKPATGWFGS